MPEQQLKAFLEQVKTDSDLKNKLNGATPDSVAAIAKEAGFVISTEQLKIAQMQVSEEELEEVAGGGRPAMAWVASVLQPWACHW